MNATLYVRHIKVDTMIGVHKHEHSSKQPVMIDISYRYDTTRATKEDDIDAAICYDTMRTCVTDFVSQAHFHLLETLVERLSMHLCAQFPHICTLDITMQKPQAMEDATVSIEHTYRAPS